MKILALDFGTKRIGYAISDSAESVAFPRSIFSALPRRQAVEKVIKIVADEKIGKIVIGVALGMENEETEISAHARSFGAEVGAATGLAVDYIDETGSSDEALAKIPFKRDRKDKSMINAVAAQIILERYLKKTGSGQA